MVAFSLDYNFISKLDREQIKNTIYKLKKEIETRDYLSKIYYEIIKKNNYDIDDDFEEEVLNSVEFNKYLKEALLMYEKALEEKRR